MDIGGRVALVLGGIKGIGKAVGTGLLENGVHVVFNYYDWEESLEELRQDADSTGVDHMILKTDLIDTGAIPGLIEKVVDRYGRLDILVNNIERGGWPVVHGSYIREQWDLEMNTTLRAKWWVFQSALPHLQASDDGVVINFSSIAGKVGRTGPASYIFNDGYAAANRGVSLLTETWAKIGAPNVRVNEIMLGIFETRHAQKTRGWGLLTEDQKKALIDHILLRRTGNMKDVVNAVLFLIRDAPYMTGSVLRLDGGYIIGGEPVHPMPEGVL